MPILRKRNFPRNLQQASTYMLLVRTVSHGHLAARKLGKATLQMSTLVAPTNQHLKKKGLKVILRQLGVSGKLTKHIFRARIRLGCATQIQSKGQLRIHPMSSANYGLFFFFTLRNYFSDIKEVLWIADN